MKYQYNVLNDEETYHGFFRVRRYEIDFELFRGGFSGAVMRECITAGGFVVVALPYDPIRKEFLLVEQFRIGAMAAGHHPWQWEAVAGFMDKEGETADACLRRELMEETGTEAKSLEHVYTYLGSPGGSAGQTHVYFAEVDSTQAATHTGLLEEGEDILVHRVPYTQAFQWLSEGKIKNATLILVLQAFLLHKTTHLYPNQVAGKEGT